MIKPWTKVSSKPVGDFRVFRLRSDLCVSPRTGASHDFYVIESVDWVQVLAVTVDQELVMVEQYRHGSATVELEIPGGMMDSSDTSALLTAARELREETGYEGDNAQLIGTVFANPAIMSNKCFFVLINNCECKHGLNFDHGEDLLTRLVPISDVPRLVADSQIGHSLVVAALYFFELWRRKSTM